MSTLPVVNNQVLLSTDAIEVTDTFSNGVLLSASTGAARAVDTGGDEYANGLLMTDAGRVVFVDATSSLPVNTVWSNGLPRSNGAICVSSAAVAYWSNGIPFAANGAVSASFFSPASLFAAGEQGAWYDPSDFSTLFQDSAGTTPVTALEQPVGLMLDKSGRGNHARQTTAASRPVLSARVNMLTATETLATQSVTTVATPYTLRFSGAGSVTLSGTATGTYTAGTHTFTPTAGTLTLTVSGSVTQADLRTRNVGVGLPAYQRVNTATDYDTQGFPLYLRCDGVDDGMVTNSIDFTGTDKMTVWAGVRKLSDAATSLVAELSANAGANNGTFALSAPEDAITFRYASFAKGFIATNADQRATLSTAVSPDTAVLTATHDIAGDLSKIRRNGVDGTNGTGDKGTGNFGNYPLFFFRRGGTTLPFNGRFYGLIVRGAQSTAQQIAQAESWMNGKTRAY